MKKRKLLGLTILLGLSLSLVACGLDSAPQETEAPFNFVAPTPAEVGSPTVEETQAQEAALMETSPTTTSDNEPSATEVELDMEVVENLPSISEKTKSNPDELTMAEKVWDEDCNNEPDVPMSVPKDNPIRGVAGTKAERFFRTLSIEPVTYHYIFFPGEGGGDLEDLRGQIEVYLSLTRGKSYMRVTTDQRDFSFLQLHESNYYEVDHKAKTYKILPGQSTQGNELSMDAFRQLDTNAAQFIDTGRGSALFAGRNVQFEEFTSDAERYVRYYFVGDVLVGHRTFEDGKIVQTVLILEASNRYDDSLFQLPGDYKQISE
ncbi:MAG: hypothetical protein Q4E09_00915 [Eubacteriales bacterium]|nr:hypothetical protein [Eubacteriales bacterium]